VTSFLKVDLAKEIEAGLFLKMTSFLEVQMAQQSKMIISNEMGECSCSLKLSIASKTVTWEGI